MLSQPLVTIYIPCRNYGNFLRQSVESVFRQTYNNWELIIIDEGSTDNSLSIAKDLQIKNPNKITLIENNEPFGLQKLSNFVLGIAKGKYMMRLDADDWLDDSAVYLLVHKLESNEDIGMVYGNYYYVDESGGYIGLESRHKLGEEDKVGQLPPHGACTLFRTRSLKSVGGYSEEVDAQDGWDLWYKLFDRIGAASIQAPVFYYRQHGSSLSKDSNRLLKARSKIFEKISSKLEGDYKPTVVAILPVKESYPDFEDVPFRKYKGKSLLEIALRNTSKSKKIDKIVVSSESKRVLEFAEQLEKSRKVPEHLRLLRDKKIQGSSSSIPIKDFMIRAAQHYESTNKSFPDIMVYLSLHAVHRTQDHIDNALNVLRLTESDCVVSVQEEREPMFKYGKNGLELINPGRFNDLSYDREKLFRFNGSIISTWWDILAEDRLFGEKTAYIEMSKDDSLQITNSSFLDEEKT